MPTYSYKKLFIIIATICIIIVVHIGLYNYKTILPAPNSRPKAAFVRVLQKQTPSLFDSSGKKLFTITETKKTANNWYLLTIKHIDQNWSEKILVYDPHFESDYMYIVTHTYDKFTSDSLSKSGVPEDVIREVLR